MKKLNKDYELLLGKESWIKWLLPLLAFILYTNTLDHQFVLDDYSVIVEHSHVQNGTNGIKEILTTNYRHGQAGFNDGLYRPLSLVSFALEKSFFNNNPRIAHLINVVLYALSILFLFISLRRIFSDQELVIPFGISLLFLSHPLHTEVVANIKSRDEIMAFLGFTVSLYSFLRVKENKLYIALAILSLVFALFSKESAAIYVLFIPALLYLEKDKKLKDLQMSLLITLPLLLVFMLWRNHVLNSMESPVDPGNFGILNNPIAATDDNGLKWGSSFSLQWIFLQKMIFPVELIHDYSYNQIPLSKLFSLSSLFGMIIYLALVILAFIGIVKKNLWGIISILYLLSISIVSQFFLPIGIQFAERMLFLSILPFAILIVFLLKKLLWKRDDRMNLKKQKNLLYVVIVIGALYSLKTIDRNADWKNNFSLYSADIEKGKNSARVNYNYGSSLSEQADLTSDQRLKNQYLNESAKYLRNAADIYPDYLDAWNNLGIVYKKLGNYDAAIQVYTANIQRDPSYSKNYYNLGTTYYQKEDYINAINSLSEYTSRKPDSPDAYMLIAQAAGQIQNFGQAISVLNAYLKYRPNDPNAFNMLGMAYGSTNQFIEADKAFTKAKGLAPNRVDILFNMAINYNRQSRTREEASTLKRIIELQPQHKAALQQLIKILENTGQTDEANKYRSML